MRATALLLLAATAALAGCNTQPDASNTAAPQDTAVEKPGSLASAFTDPAGTAAKLNQFGYRLGEYKNGANGFSAGGEPVFLSRTDTANPNRGTAEITGTDAAAIDRIAFTVTLTDTVNADIAKKQLTDNIRGFLFQFGVKDDKALAAIPAEQASDTPIGGAPATIAVDKAGTASRITATFQRPTATAPADTAVHNTQQP